MMRRIFNHVVLLAVLSVAFFAQGGCKEKSGSANANAHEGQGAEVTTDPAFAVKLSVETGGAEITIPLQQLAVYQSKPAKTPEEAERPQGFELRGDNFVLAGALPKELRLAPQRKFDMLVNQPLAVRQRGGDPTAAAMSKILLADGKIYLARSGTLTVDNAFHRTGQYAGVSGHFDVELQEIKLGNPDDPQDREDKPVGNPIKGKGTFTARAAAYPYESL